MALQTFQVTYAATLKTPDVGPASLLIEPERVPVQGTVTFSPSVAVLLEDDGDPEDVYLQPETYGFLDGVLVDGEGNPAVALVSPWSEDLGVQGWNWIASFNLRGGIKRDPIIIPTSDCTPGATVNLTQVAPVTAIGNTPVVRGPKGDPGPVGLDNHVVHLDNPNVARPNTTKPVFWYGWVEPVNKNPAYNDMVIEVYLDGQENPDFGDADIAALIANVGSATYAALAEKFVTVAQLAITPTSPGLPTAGRVWIKNA